MKGSNRATWTALAFLLPNFAGFMVFTFLPVLFSIGIAFTNWSIIRTVPFRFVGFDNFTEMLHDLYFWQALANTLYLLIGMPVSMAASILLAIALSQKLRGVVLYRTLLYLPSFTAGVALFILWKKLYNPDFGPINVVLRHAFDLAGLTAWEAPTWLGSTKNLLGLGVDRLGLYTAQFGLGARDALILMGIWTTAGGGNMLLYLAGLSNIPRELYEAADIDGAGAWARFRHVTWPQLAPTTFFILVMSFIGGLQGGFEQARIMTAGGPARTTTTMAYYIFEKAFLEYNIGYAAAMAWVLFAMIFAVTLVNWRYGSRHVNY